MIYIMISYGSAFPFKIEMFSKGGKDIAEDNQETKK